MQIVKSKYTRKSWLEKDGKRLSKKVIKYKQNTVGVLGMFITSHKTIVYDTVSDEIICQISAKDMYIKVDKISTNLYAVRYTKEKSTAVKLYDAGSHKWNGTKILDIRTIKNGMIATKTSAGWGYISEEPRWLIEPMYEDVTDFNDGGYAIVTFKSGKRKAVITKNNSCVVNPFECYSTEFLTPELIKVYFDHKNGILNIKGKFIVPVKYSKVTLKNNYIIVELNEKYGLYDLDGNVIFECIYPEIIETDDKFIVHDFPRKEALKEKRNKLI